MSEQFYYVHLKFVPKIVILTGAILCQREVIVEVSKRLVRLRQLEGAGENLEETAIALDLARRTALGTFPTVAEQILGLCWLSSILRSITAGSNFMIPT